MWALQIYCQRNRIIKSIAVIAAGTDPGSPTKIDISTALVERDTSFISPQYLVAASI